MDCWKHIAHGTGYHKVDTGVSCVLTRFRVRSVWSMFLFYRLFRRIRQEARGLKGLLTSVFLVEDFRTCYTLSFWSDERAIYEFNAKVRAHIQAANRAFRELRFEEGRIQLWSAQFRLAAVSPHNLQWKELGLSVSDDATAPQWDVGALSAAEEVSRVS